MIHNKDSKIEKLWLTTFEIAIDRFCEKGWQEELLVERAKNVSDAATKAYEEKLDKHGAFQP